MEDLTIVIPCFEKPETVAKSIEGNKEILKKYPVIVINKKGGEALKPVSSVFFQQDTSFWFARRFGLEFVKTKYILCLDIDTILPPKYIEKAIELLEKDPTIGAIALYYERSIQDHLAFGTSIWRTKELKNLYDWRLTYPPISFDICECKYMWNKLEKANMKVETLPMKAIHLKYIITKKPPS